VYDRKAFEEAKLAPERDEDPNINMARRLLERAWQNDQQDGV